jgi:hypothetical protein
MGRPLFQSFTRLGQSWRRRRAGRSGARLAAAAIALGLGAPAHAQESVPAPAPESAPAVTPDTAAAPAPDNTPPPEPRLQIAGYGGYQFGGAAHASSIETEINESGSFGATLSYRIGHGAFAEIAYSHQSTDISVDSPNLGTNVYDFSADYLTIGGMTQFRIPGTDIIRPVFAGSLGTTHFNANGRNYDYNDWYFLVILEGGAVFPVNPNFGFRLRGRLLTTFLTTDTALFCGSANGCTASFSGIGLFQGEFGGGAYVAF